jgi:hypothetical protein
MLLTKPYFLENDDWYYHDEIEWCYKLTANGLKNPKVLKSYEDFYALLNNRIECPAHINELRAATKKE